jgi:hypothetical protein
MLQYFSVMCIIVGILTLCTVLASSRTSEIGGIRNVDNNNLFSRFVLSVVIIGGCIYCTSEPSWWATAIYCYASLVITMYCFKENSKSHYRDVVENRKIFIVNLGLYFPIMLAICIISVCIDFTWYTTLVFLIPITATFCMTLFEIYLLLRRF